MVELRNSSTYLTLFTKLRKFKFFSAFFFLLKIVIDYLSQITNQSLFSQSAYSTFLEGALLCFSFINH